MARLDGQPKMVSERYLGTAAEIAAAVQGREEAALPEWTQPLAFGTPPPGACWTNSALPGSSTRYPGRARCARAGPASDVAHD
jgi:hypothetical protein